MEAPTNEDEVADVNKSEEDDQAPTDPGSLFAYADECKAVLQQVPKTFYFGTTQVGLTCMDVGEEYIVLGSDCGAIFIFNRRINRPVNPLRTNYDEVITRVRVFSGDDPMMAAGHKSGAIVLIRFPSGQPNARRKMEQNRLTDSHRGHRITSLEWTNDASRLFSADQSGIVVVTRVDFDNNSFEPTFICNEGYPITSMSYSLSNLLVCSSRRIALIHVDSASDAVEISNLIDDYSEDRCGVHLCDQISNQIALVSSQKGVLYTFHVDNGSPLANIDIKQQILDKMNCECFSESNVPLNESDTEVLSRVYALDECRLVIFLKRHAVHLTMSQTNVGVIDVMCLRDVELLRDTQMLDVSSDGVSLFVLTVDRHVIRLGTNPAPQQLITASEPVEEFGALSLMSTLQKTTKLLPYAPTSAILNKLKSNGEMHALNLPFPLISNILRSSRQSSEASLGGESSSRTESPIREKVPDFVTTNNTEVDDTIHPSDADTKSEQIADQVEATSKNTTPRVEPTGKEEHHVVLDWAVSNPNWLLDNMNDMAKRVVDAVGGIGVVADDGYIEHPTVPSLPSAPSFGSDSLPYEQIGLLEEVAVSRTKKALGKKKKSVGSESMKSLKFDSLSSGTDDIGSIDEQTLDEIRKALLGISEPSVAQYDQDNHEDSEHETEAQVTQSDHDSSPELSIAPCTANATTSQTTEVNQEGPDTSEKSGCEKGKEDLHRLSPQEDVVVPECSAYETLMKRALLNKTARFAGSPELCEYFNEEADIERLIVNDRGDIWNEIKLPYSVVSFAVSSHYMVVCHAKRKKKPRYMTLPDVSTGNWLPLKHDAESIATNDLGSLVWRMHKGIAYSPEVASCSSPSANNWIMCANEGRGVLECALTNDSAWYITNTNEVYVQLRLPEMGILSRCECPWKLESITASEVAVWALQKETGKLVVRAGLKHCPVGLDWVEIEPAGPTRLLSVCLFERSGWAVDESRSLWFTNGVDYSSPFGTSGAWLQVCRPWDLSLDSTRLHSLPCSVRVSSLGVFVCMSRRVYWASASSPLTGHRFKRIVPDKLAINDSFEVISAGCARVNNVDALALCRNNEVFLYRLRNRNFYSLPAYPSSYGSTLVQLISFETSVYVLDSSGCIFVRRNLSDVAPFGVEWTALNTGACGSPIVSFAVTSVSIWVITSESQIMMLKRSTNNELCLNEPAEWTNVRPPHGDVSFDQIRASCSGIYVWIFSKVSGRSWARNAVSAQMPTGKSWTEACDDPGVGELAVGCRVVWALSSTGQLYRLRGLAAGNPAGNYWKDVPVTLAAIAIDDTEHLWGIDHERRLVSHAVEVYPPIADRGLSDITLSPDSIESTDDFVKY